MNAEGRGYRPALDGVRAVAVVGVLLYHGGLSAVTGGILGVDVFFVLSGYLITDLLVREWDRWGSIDVVTFYVHRARRLLPALCLVVAAIAIWALTFGQSDRLGSYRGDGIATLLYVANWRFVLSQQSYFDQFADPSPFRHTWSLAIEEQYYLFFPLVLICLLTLGRRHRTLVVGGVLSALAVLSAVEMVWLYHPGGDPSRVYYGTDTRFFELMVGSILAVLMVARRTRPARDGSPRARTAAVSGALALAGVAWMMHATTDQQPFLFRGGFALLCLVTAVLLWSIEVAPRSPVARLLSTPPFVYVGKISYGLYLWHWPVFVAVSPAHTSLEDGPVLLLVRLGLSLLLAVASYVLVEQPIRTGVLRRMRPPRGRLIALAGMPVALAVLLFGTAEATPPPLADSPFGVSVGNGSHRLLVVGDSVGMSLASFFPAARYPDWKVDASAKLGCGLASDQQLAFHGQESIANNLCGDEIHTWGQKAALTRPDAVLLVIGAWEVYDHVVDGQILSVGSKGYAHFLRDRLEKTLAAVAPGNTPLYMTDVPCYDQQSVAPNGFDLSSGRDDPARVASVNRVIRAFARAHRGKVRVLDLSSHLCPNGSYLDKLNGVELRPDGVHFSRYSAPLAWDWLMRSISKSQPDDRLAVMSVGDSVPLGLSEKFPHDRYPAVSVTDSTMLGCSLVPATSVADGQALALPATCAPWFDHLDQAIGKAAPDVGLVYAGIGEQFDKQVDGHELSFGSPAWHSWLVTQLTHVVDLYRNRGIPVLMPTVPCHQVPDYGTTPIPGVINDAKRVDVVNSVVREVAQSYPRGDVAVADLDARLCSGGYTNSLGGVTLRTDGLHFTPDGAALVWKFLMPHIRRLEQGHRTRG